MDDDERERGILTKDDRKYLRGERELSEGSEYNARRRIRRRVQNALLDMPILLRHLSETDRNKIAGAAADSPLATKEQVELSYAIKWGVMFLYVLHEGDFEETVEYAIDADLKKKGLVGMANVEIDVFDTKPIETADPGERSVLFQDESGERYGLLREPGGLVQQYSARLRESMEGFDSSVSRILEGAIPNFSDFISTSDFETDEDDSESDE